MMEVQTGPSFWPAGPTTTTASSLPTDPLRPSGRSDLGSASHANAVAALFDSLYPPTTPTTSGDAVVTTRKMRKRKAEGQDNERLSKRLSLLNLEQNGAKLYVPVESPRLQPTSSTSLRPVPESDGMQLDSADSKHKVYIYDLDAELSDSGESDDGKLIFLPDIEKHLLQNRIPPAVLANRDGELAGVSLQDMQMVLYSEPKSLTVPQEQDSVRKAILEARSRIRRRQRVEADDGDGADADDEGDGSHNILSLKGKESHSSSSRTQSGLRNLANDDTKATSATIPPAMTNGHTWPASPSSGPDLDAMDLD